MVVLQLACAWVVRARMWIAGRGFWILALRAKGAFEEASWLFDSKGTRLCSCCVEWWWCLLAQELESFSLTRFMRTLLVLIDLS